MILTGKEILKCVNNGTIVISPFDQKNLQANSYDFHIDNMLKVYKEDVLDAQNVNDMEEIIIPENGLLLNPNQIYIGKTQEVIGSNNYVPIIKGRSSTGRLGIFVNITADLIDLGSIKQCTLMLNSVLPVKIYPNMPIGQVTFWSVEGEI
jgi:dCTP deaminase